MMNHRVHVLAPTLVALSRPPPSHDGKLANVNPYVPPTSEVPSPKRTAQSRFWTRAFVTATIVRVTLLAALLALSAISPRLDASLAGLVLKAWPWGTTAVQITFFAGLVCAGRWLKSMWEALPQKDWKVGTISTSPQGAVALLCIPIFNYYWMFAMNLGLCERYESRAYGPWRKETDLSGRGLVLSAGSLTLIGLLGTVAVNTPLSVLQYATTVAAPLFWIFYMRHLDALRARFDENEA